LLFQGKDLLFGEFKSLEMLQMANAVRVPKPIKVVSSYNTTILITEYIQFRGLKVFQGELGHQLAMYFIIPCVFHPITNLNDLLFFSFLQTTSKELGTIEDKF
jgi:hypothetical protein